MNVTDVAIVGAGPYGLSIAAHLHDRDVDLRIFGKPMESWRSRMPAGMSLKSEGFASNLYDPQGHFSLRAFCAQNGLKYGERGVPVPVTTLVSYGLNFQKRLVPDLDERSVEAVEVSSGGFLLRLEGGETVAARRVVIATGILYYQHIPPGLAQLPAGLVSHSGDHHDVSGFRGREVVILGAGASAFDLAAALAEAGAKTSVIARRATINWTELPHERSLWERIRYPMSGMSPGIRSRLYEDLPRLFRYLPAGRRLEIIRTFLGAAPAWWIKEQIAGRVEILTGHRLERVEARGDRVQLRVTGPSGARAITADHLVAATGYQVDVRRLPFLNEDICGRLKLLDRTPVLSPSFESTVPGLYFVGLPSALSFGPMMRFMLGAGYTSKKLAAHLAEGRLRRPVSSPAAAVSPAGT